MTQSRLGEPKSRGSILSRHNGELWQCGQRHRSTVSASERWFCCHVENTLEGGWMRRQSARGNSSVQVPGDSGLQRQEVNGFKRQNEGLILERGCKWVEGSDEKMQGDSKETVISSKGLWDGEEARKVSMAGCGLNDPQRMNIPSPTRMTKRKGRSLKRTHWKGSIQDKNHLSLRTVQWPCRLTRNACSTSRGALGRESMYITM